MPRLLIVFWLLFFCSARPGFAEYKLVFEDNFNTLDQKIWSLWNPECHFQGYNTFEATEIKDGILIIYARTETKNDLKLHKTCMISTENHFRAAQGKWEIRVRTTGANGIFSGFWVYSRGLTENNPPIGQEINLFESRKTDLNNKYIGGGVMVGSHWNGYLENHKSINFYTGNLSLDDQKFHIYTLIWLENNLIYLIDNIEVFKSKSMSNELLFPILSSEIQNGWAGLVEDSYSQKTLEIDFIRYWKDEKL